MGKRPEQNLPKNVVNATGIKKKGYIKVKVKYTPVQALRFCTGLTASKVHPCTGTEVLYRPYGQ